MDKDNKTTDNSVGSSIPEYNAEALKLGLGTASLISQGISLTDEQLLNFTGNDKQKARNIELGAGALGAGYLFLPTVRKVVNTAVKNPLKTSTMVGGAMVGGRLIGDITDATGLTQGLGYKANLLDPSFRVPFTNDAEIRTSDALKYATIFGTGAKTWMNYSKDYEKYLEEFGKSKNFTPQLKELEIKLPEAAPKKGFGLLPPKETENTIRIKPEYTKAPETGKPLSKMEYIQKAGEDIEKSRLEKIQKIQKGYGSAMDKFGKKIEGFEGFRKSEAIVDKGLQKFIKDKQAQEETKRVLEEISKRATKLAPALKVMNALTKRIPAISAGWDTLNAVGYALEGDSKSAIYKGIEAADQALWYLPGWWKLLGAATIPANMWLDTKVAENRKLFKEQQEQIGRDIKGITLNEKGEQEIPKDAKVLSREEAFKYASKGREISPIDSDHYYLVDKDKTKVTEKIDMASQKNVTPEPPQVTFEFPSSTDKQEIKPTEQQEIKTESKPSFVENPPPVYTLSPIEKKPEIAKPTPTPVKTEVSLPPSYPQPTTIDDKKNVVDLHPDVKEQLQNLEDKLSQLIDTNAAAASSSSSSVSKPIVNHPKESRQPIEENRTRYRFNY
jgi:hypothetical protein